MTRTRSLRIAVFALVAFGGLAACGDSPEQTPAPPKAVAPKAKATPSPAGMAPCLVVSRAEATVALGTAATAGQAKREARGGTCTYTGGSADKILIAIFNGPVPEIKSRFDYAASRPKVRDEYEPVTGIGDRALVRGGAPGATLFFYKGTVLVSIMLTTDRARTRAVAAVTELGKAAAGRI